MAGRFDEAGFRAQIGPNTQVFAGAWLRSAARIELTERVLETAALARSAAGSPCRSKERTRHRMSDLAKARVLAPGRDSRQETFYNLPGFGGSDP
jgi:hypothetical protein